MFQIGDSIRIGFEKKIYKVVQASEIYLMVEDDHGRWMRVNTRFDHVAPCLDKQALFRLATQFKSQGDENMYQYYKQLIKES